MPAPPSLRILSIDHGAHDLVPVAEAAGADPACVPAFKQLAVKACLKAADGREGYGMFLEGQAGRAALFDAARQGLWLARQFPHGEPGAFADHPLTWPAGQVVKLIANARSDARLPLERRLPEIAEAMAISRSQRRETLIEALPAEGQSTAALLERLYAQGLKPDYWLIEPSSEAAGWAAISDVLAREDRYCRGLIVIARKAESVPELEAAAQQPQVVGFVGGRAIFGEPFRRWLAGTMDDAGAIDAMAESFARLAQAFDAGRQQEGSR
jgi:5-dehydro-2-deoxygluconokinase